MRYRPSALICSIERRAKRRQSAGLSWLSLTRSRRVPEYEIDWSEWTRQYERLFNDAGWAISLHNLVILGIGSALAIVFGFVLAAMIDREWRGESFFRTVFLYPLAVSLIVTGAAWRWIFNPQLGLQNFLHDPERTRPSAGLHPLL